MIMHFQLIRAHCTKCNESTQHSITEHGPRCNACGYMGGDTHDYTNGHIIDSEGFNWTMIRNSPPFPIIAKFRNRYDAFQATDLFNEKAEG